MENISILAMNWATESAGARVVDCSSEVAGCDSSHVIQESLSSIWLSNSDEGLPQWLCICQSAKLVIRTIGWHCWHSYSTNPKVVQLHVSCDGSKFKVWDTLIVSQQMKGTQLFCCAPIDTVLHPFIALEVVQTFGASQTYMNRVYFYSDEVDTSFPNPSRNGKEQRDLDRSFDSALPTILSVSMMTQQSFLNKSKPLISDSRLKKSQDRMMPQESYEGVSSRQSPPTPCSSFDTDDLADKLQDALGIKDDDNDDGLATNLSSKYLSRAGGTELDYFESDSLSSDGHVVIKPKTMPNLVGSPYVSSQMPAILSISHVNAQASPASLTPHTLAGRIQSLEQTVSSLDKRLHEPIRNGAHSKHANVEVPSSHQAVVVDKVVPNTVTIGRHSEAEGSPKASGSRAAAVLDTARLAAVGGRLSGLEEKFVGLLELLEQLQPQPPLSTTQIIGNVASSNSKEPKEAPSPGHMLAHPGTDASSMQHGSFSASLPASATGLMTAFTQPPPPPPPPPRMQQGTRSLDSSSQTMDVVSVEQLPIQNVAAEAGNVTHGSATCESSSGVARVAVNTAPAGVTPTEFQSTLQQQLSVQTPKPADPSGDVATSATDIERSQEDSLPQSMKRIEQMVQVVLDNVASLSHGAFPTVPAPPARSPAGTAPSWGRKRSDPALDAFHAQQYPPVRHTRSQSVVRRSHGLSWGGSGNRKGGRGQEREQKEELKGEPKGEPKRELRRELRRERGHEGGREATRADDASWTRLRLKPQVGAQASDRLACSSASRSTRLGCADEEEGSGSSDRGEQDSSGGGDSDSRLDSCSISTSGAPCWEGHIHDLLGTKYDLKVEPESRSSSYFGTSELCSLLDQPASQTTRSKEQCSAHAPKLNPRSQRIQSTGGAYEAGLDMRPLPPQFDASAGGISSVLPRRLSDSKNVPSSRPRLSFRVQSSGTKQFPVSVGKAVAADDSSSLLPRAGERAGDVDWASYNKERAMRRATARAQLRPTRMRGSRSRGAVGGVSGEGAGSSSCHYAGDGSGHSACPGCGGPQQSSLPQPWNGNNDLGGAVLLGQFSDATIIPSDRIDSYLSDLTHTLYEKIYQRTLKRAQMDILSNASRGVNS